MQQEKLVQPISTAVHMLPNKLWRSNSIFNLCFFGDSFGSDHSARELRRPDAGERHLPPASEARGHPGTCSW